MINFALYMLRYTCQNTNTTDTQQEAKNSRLSLKIRLLEENKLFKTSTFGKYISHLILITTLQNWFIILYL